MVQRVFDLRVERSAGGSYLNVIARPPSGGIVSVPLDQADVLRWDEDIKRIQDTDATSLQAECGRLQHSPTELSRSVEGKCRIDSDKRVQVPTVPARGNTSAE